MTVPLDSHAAERGQTNRYNIRYKQARSVLYAWRVGYIGNNGRLGQHHRVHGNYDNDNSHYRNEYLERDQGGWGRRSGGQQGGLQGGRRVAGEHQNPPREINAEGWGSGFSNEGSLDRRVGDEMGKQADGYDGDFIEPTKLRLDGGTQSRAGLDEATVAEYTQTLIEDPDVRFPPVKVVFDGKNHWLVDGFHRIEAAQIAAKGMTEILADCANDLVKADKEWQQRLDEATQPKKAKWGRKN